MSLHVSSQPQTRSPSPSARLILPHTVGFLLLNWQSFSVPPLSVEALAPRRPCHRSGVQRGGGQKTKMRVGRAGRRPPACPCPAEWPFHFSEGGPASWAGSLPTLPTPTASSTSSSGDESWSSLSEIIFFLSKIITTSGVNHTGGKNQERASFHASPGKVFPLKCWFPPNPSRREEGKRKQG